MNKKIVGLIGIILSLVILLYFESFAYQIISIIGININSYSNLVINIVNICIKLVMCFLVYFIFKKDFKKRHSRDNIFKTILMFCIYLIVLVIGMYIFKYIIDFIGDIFNISILNIEFYNIFNKTLDIKLIMKIFNDFMLTPYLYCTIILLSVDKLCKRNDTFYIFSGLFAGIIYAFNLNGTLGYVILNSLYTAILFLILGIIYKRENSIWFSIILYSFYLISSAFIINYLGW